MENINLNCQKSEFKLIKTHLSSKDAILIVSHVLSEETRYSSENQSQLRRNAKMIMTNSSWISYLKFPHTRRKTRDANSLTQDFNLYSRPNSQKNNNRNK